MLELLFRTEGEGGGAGGRGWRGGEGGGRGQLWGCVPNMRETCTSHVSNLHLKPSQISPLHFIDEETDTQGLISKMANTWLTQI